MKERTHEVCILVRDNDSGIIGVANNFVANFKQYANPNILIKECASEKDAVKEYFDAVRVSEESSWKVVYRGKPLIG